MSPGTWFRCLSAFLCCLLGAACAQAQELAIYTEESGHASFVDASGKPAGSSVEIVEELLRRLDTRAEIRLVPWARGYQAVSSSPNTILFSMTRTAERENQFKWVGPVAKAKWILYGKAGRGPRLTSLDEARRLRAIGVVRADVKADYLRAAGFTNLEEVTSSDLNVKKLMADRLDVMVGTNLGIAQAASVAGLGAEQLSEVLQFREAELYIAFSRQTADDLVERWVRALAEMKRDGSFRRIYRKWYPHESGNF